MIQFVNSMNDLSAIDQLDYFVTQDFQVTFGSGCSIVGGGVFCGEGEACSYLTVHVPVAQFVTASVHAQGRLTSAASKTLSEATLPPGPTLTSITPMGREAPMQWGL